MALSLAATLILMGSVAAWAITTNVGRVRLVHEPAADLRVDQKDLTGMVVRRQPHEAFENAFELGDEIFASEFNSLDGVGANVGRGQRFNRVPRADLKGPREWFNHTPPRPTGPNAQACTNCHAVPFEDGAGPVVMNVLRDPLRTGQLGSFIQRNTPHLFGSGAVQRLAEEMTAELHAIRDRARTEACATGTPRTAPLSTKGIDFVLSPAPETPLLRECEECSRTS
jgi:hypothetical protein